MTELKHKRLPITVKALRKRLARRFSIIGQKYDFSVSINGEEITVDDREDLKNLQFFWKIGEYEPEENSIQNVIEQAKIEDSIIDYNKSWRVSGWIGTTKKPHQLKSEESGSLNGIVILARGRLIHENLLEKLNSAHLYTKYLTGQIQADFLDVDSEEDIATSDRQRIQEDDPRFTKLVEFLERTLKNVESKWTEWRNKHSTKEAKERSQGIRLWLDGLPDEYKESGESLIEKISSIEIDHDEDKKLLFRHGILAFERMKLRSSKENLVASLDSIPKLLEILANRDDLEASLYRDIINSRLDAIERIQELKEERALEEVFQKYLFNHLWLLDPAWDRVEESKRMEASLIEEGIIVKSLTEKEKYSRIDIAYRTYVGKHIIVELKRADIVPSLKKLRDQGELYVDKLTKILQNQNIENPDIEVIFVLGKRVKEQSTNPQRFKSAMEGISPGSRVVYYEQLMRNAVEAYKEFLMERDNVDKLAEILRDI